MSISVHVEEQQTHLPCGRCYAHRENLRPETQVTLWEQTKWRVKWFEDCQNSQQVNSRSWSKTGQTRWRNDIKLANRQGMWKTTEYHGHQTPFEALVHNKTYWLESPKVYWATIEINNRFESKWSAEQWTLNKAGDSPVNKLMSYQQFESPAGCRLWRHAPRIPPAMTTRAINNLLKPPWDRISKKPIHSSPKRTSKDYIQVPMTTGCKIIFT